jgi:drug/metabolite transporter (DMT)-like permease
MQGEKRFAAFAALIGGVVAVGWSAIFVRWTEMPGVSSAFYRMLIASVVMWGILMVQRGHPRKIDAQVIPLAFLGGVFFAADVGFFNVAVMHTEAGSATFLGNNAPVVVGLLTWAITRKLPSGRFWLALALAVVGGALIVSIDWGRLRSASGADMIAVAASVAFALYLVATERLRTIADTTTIVTLSATASAAALLVFALFGHISLAVPGLHPLLACVGLGIICQVAGYWFLTYALGHLPATVSSVVMLGVAPITAILAYFLFGEAMTPVQLLGGALILAAVWMISHPTGKGEGDRDQGATE